MTEIEVKQQAEEKAAALSQQLNVKVHALVFKDENENFITGFIKEPSRQVKLAVLDKSVMGGFSAASEMLDAILLKEHSDPRLVSERPEDDKIYLGAVMASYDLIRFNVNTLKKKIAQHEITAESSEESQVGAFIRCYLHLDPDALTDDQLAKEWGRLKYWLKKTGQME